MVAGSCQFLSLSLGEYPSLEQPLIWCLRGIIDLVHLSPMPCLFHQLHHWLEEINIETGKLIDAVQSFQGSSRVIPVVANQASHYRPVSLLYMAAIILLIRAGAGKGNLVPPAIIIEMLVNELTTVV